MSVEPIGLGPSAPSLPRRPLPGRKPGCDVPTLCPWEGDRVSSPTWWLSCPGTGWGPGPKQLGDTAMTVCRPRAPLLPRPRHQPAQPQHQGSREALPRHRLSLRCQELWMRLRASSNFFLEASWMALCGRSTCVGRGRNLRAAPRALREPRGPSAPGVTLPWN